MPSAKRSGSAAAVVSAALVVVAGAYAAAGDPKKHINATDQAYAKTFVLRKADLPGASWGAEPTNFNQANPACVVKHYSLSALTATGQAGVTYTQADRAIESDGRVFATSAQAERAFSIFSSIGLGRCLASSLAAELTSASSGLQASVTNVTPLSFAGLAQPARGVRIGLRVRGSKEIKSIRYVFMSIRRGRAVSTLGLVRYNADWADSAVRPLAAVTAQRLTKP